MKLLLFLQRLIVYCEVMKKQNLIIAVVLLLAACTPQNYYQLLETQGKIITPSNSLITFENKDLIISYDLWGDKGNGSFIVFNKTEKDILIDLKRSHLIINDVAHTYFQNRTFSSPKTSFFSSDSEEQIMERKGIKLPGVSPKTQSLKGSESVVSVEERYICIPPKSSQAIVGFNLLEKIYRDCNIYRFPTNKNIRSTEFDMDNSPLKYRNRLTYSYDDVHTTSLTFENEFFVNRITNYPENEFIKYENIKFCSDSSSYSSQIFPFYKSSSFFIKYKLEPGRIDH